MYLDMSLSRYTCSDVHPDLCCMLHAFTCVYLCMYTLSKRLINDLHLSPPPSLFETLESETSGTRVVVSNSTSSCSGGPDEATKAFFSIDTHI